MTLPTTNPQQVSDRVHAIAQSLGLVRDDYNNREAAPFTRYSFYGRRYGYEFQSAVRATRHWKARNILTLIRGSDTDDEITEKIRKFRARAEKTYREQIAEAAEHERQQKEFEAREKEREQSWLGAIRVAFGNPADKPLEGDTLPKVLAKRQLVESRVSESIVIDLPRVDHFADPQILAEQQTRRARFLAELDALLAKQLAGDSETSETPVNK